MTQAFAADQALSHLLATPASDLARGFTRWEIGGMSLVCAFGLPGAQDLDIPAYYARLQQWAQSIHRYTQARLHLFKESPDRSRNSLNVFRIQMLVQCIKLDFKCHYNPDRRTDLDDRCHLPFWDSKDLLIHGLLSEKRSGTCNNIPMLVVALACRLGYPVQLVATPTHVFARWDDGQERFNIEASNPAAMVIHDDDYYRTRPIVFPQELRSDYYLRSFTSRTTWPCACFPAPGYWKLTGAIAKRCRSGSAVLS